MSDEDAIRSLLSRHFDALRWAEGSLPDWDRFSADFLPEALFFPAATPVQVRSRGAFI